MTALDGSAPLFDGLATEALDELAGHALLRRLDAGDALCRAGELGSSLYVVQRGLLHVLGPTDRTLLGRQRPGDVAGEAALLTGEPRSATVLARVPSEVAELPRAAFLAVAERHPVLLANLARLVSRRLVARTVGRGDARRRETTAVVVGFGPVRVPDIVRATQATSPVTIRVLDFTAPDAPAEDEALARLEVASARPGRPCCWSGRILPAWRSSSTTATGWSR